jgi:predicted ATP-grasp superfamily ATP-dependent carboligase
VTPQGRCTILVTDAARGSAVSIIRSLGRRGHRIVAMDSTALSPGFRSRFTSGRVRGPDPATQPEAFARVVGRASSKRGVDLVIPITEEAILALAAHPEVLEPTTRLAVAPAPAMETTRDKWATLELARRLGVPAPKTVLVTSLADVDEAARDLSFPVVMKPRRSRLLSDGRVEAFAVGYAGSHEELRRAMAGLLGRVDVLVQEFVEGDGHGVELCLREGIPLAAFQHHRLREVPVTGGASSYREGVALDPTLYRYATDLMSELRWTGLAMVEFKVGPDGPRLMEVNGRVWGSLPLAVQSGVDFGGFVADVFLGEADGSSRPSIGDYETGIRSHDLGLELVWIGSVLRGRARYPFLPFPPRRAAAEALVSLIDPRSRYDILSADDLVPAAADLVRVAHRIGRKVIDG